jgi:hypothetical protein
MAELGARHARLEAEGDFDGLMSTLVDDPVYEFRPVGLRMAGGEQVRQFYSQFIERFLPMQHGAVLLGEWVNETSVAQEYDVSLDVEGIIETHRVLGILQYGERGLLGGERVYASERFIRLMTGPVFEFLEPF